MLKVTVEGNDTALTISRVTRNDQLNKVDTATAKTGAPAVVELNIGAHAARVVVEITPPPNATANVSIEQNTRMIDDASPCVGDTRFVFDVAP